MDFYSVVKTRRSIRSFEAKEIEKEKLDRIIAACTLAPSAGNLQSFVIYVAKNKQLKQDLVIASLGQEFIEQAPVVLIFCADKNRSAMKYGDRGYELYATQDATIAASYAQLAAVAESLASVWIGKFDPLEVSRLLNLDSYLVPVAMIPLGYPSGQPRPHERRSIGEIVKEII